MALYFDGHSLWAEWGNGLEKVEGTISAKVFNKGNWKTFVNSVEEYVHQLTMAQLPRAKAIWKEWHEQRLIQENPL